MEQRGLRRSEAMACGSVGAVTCWADKTVTVVTFCLGMFPFQEAMKLARHLLK